MRGKGGTSPRRTRKCYIVLSQTIVNASDAPVQRMMPRSGWLSRSTRTRTMVSV